MTTTNGSQTQLQTTGQRAVAPSPAQTFRGVLEKMIPQIKLALPRHVSPDRLVRIVLTTVQRTPKLLECTRESLLGCIVQCAQLGLEPDGMLGHAYLVPFWNSRQNRLECQFIAGYKGLLKLARQSGEIASVASRVVHAKDEFEYEYGLNEKLRHIPCDDEDPGSLTHAYTIFRFKDGSHHFDVMTKREIDRIKARSKAPKGGPWDTDYEEMAKKTVFRRTSKMAPASVEDKMSRALQLDDRADQGLSQEFDVDVPGAGDDGEGTGSTGAAESSETTNEGGAESTPEFVISTLKQRKDLAKAAKAARVAEADVAAWYKRDSLEELSRDEADEALKRLAEMDDGGGAIS